MKRREKKMKIGDLVALSAYGSKLGCNLRLKHAKVKVGIIIEVIEGHGLAYPYKVRWLSTGGFSPHSRRELKLAK